MTQEDRWKAKFNDVMDFMDKNKRNPSRYDDNERGLYCNWIKHNKKLMRAGGLKPDRVEMFERILTKMEEYKRVNQYQ